LEREREKYSFGILYTGYLISVVKNKREREREIEIERVREIERDKQIKPGRFRQKTARKKCDKKFDLR
jgi:hypothetical protein